MAGSEVVAETVVVRPGARVAPFARRYIGYRYAGFAPGIHLGLPSRHLTVVISLGAPNRTVAMPDPWQPPADLPALAGGLHTRPAVLPHEHAELRGPAGGGVMSGSIGRDDSPISGLPAGTGSIYLVTGEPDALFERALKAGATVVKEPHDSDNGSRDFTVRDPEGVFWNFGTYGGAAP